MEHRFKIGEVVAMTPSFMRPTASPQDFEVTRLLPERDGEFQYRVKGTGESHERVVRESELISPGGVPEAIGER